MDQNEILTHHRSSTNESFCHMWNLILANPSCKIFTAKEEFVWGEVRDDNGVVNYVSGRNFGCLELSVGLRKYSQHSKGSGGQS